MSLQSPPLTIYIGPTSIYFRSRKDGQFGNCSLEKFMKDYLQEYEFNPRFNRNVATYRYSLYDEEFGLAVLPRYSLDKLLQFFTEHGVNFELKGGTVVSPRHAKIELKKHVKPRADQEEIVSFLSDQKLMYHPLSAQTGSGKMLENHTLVRVPGGWKEIGSLTVGEFVVAPDGTPTKVIGVYPQGERRIYKVVFSDNRTIEAGGEHLWLVNVSGKEQVLTTKECQRLLEECGIRPAVPLIEPDQAISRKQHVENLNQWMKSAKGFSITVDWTYSLLFAQTVWALGGRIDSEVMSRENDYDVHMEFSLKHASDVQWNKDISDEEIQKHLADKLPMRRIEDTKRYAECTCIAVDHPSHCYVVENYIVTHNTVMTMMAMSHLSLTTMIVLPCLIPQWYKAIRQFTTVKPDEIYVIQGFDSLKKLWKMRQRGYFPKIIIFATRTLLLYATTSSAAYEDVPSYNDFQRAFGIGVKVIDEVHLGFNTNVLIDLSSRIQHNLYLSATYKRTNRIGRRIFDMVFPKELIYTGNKKKAYTVITLLSYSIGLGGSEISQFLTYKGYNHAKFESYILKLRELSQEFFYRVIPAALKMYYLDRKKDGFKALVLCQTQDFAKMLYKAILTYTKQQEEKYRIGLFFSGTTKQSELSKDIIVSTVKSCGTGMDIPGLICCINTISFSSPVLTIQMAGRLREIPGEETQFIDLWCRDISVHMRHKESRILEYKSIAKRLDFAEL